MEWSSSWNNCKLEDIADIVGGGTPRTEVDSYWDGDIKWYTPSEIGKSKYILDSERHITEDGLNNSSAKLLPKYTILLSSRATVGEISIALTECSTNQGFQSLITKKNTDNDFIYYLISTMKNEFLRRSSGSTFLEISKNEIKRIKINIPTLDEQKKIAKFFSSIDNKIELLEKKHQYYQDFKKYLMQQIFAQKLRFADFTEEWEVKKLGDIVEFLDNKRIPLNEDTRNNQKDIYPYYGASGIIDYVEDYIFDEELILIGEDGTIDVNLASGKYWVSNHAHVLRANDNINQYYLTEFLKTVNFEIYNTGTIQPKLNKETCKTIPIRLPNSLEEQNLIANCFFEVNTKMGIFQNQIFLTKKFKEGLLQQMFI